MEPAQVSFWPRIFLWSSYSSRRISAVLPLISWTCNALDYDGLWLGTLTVAIHMRRLFLWHLRTHAINLRQLNWKEQRHTWQEQPHTHAHTFAVSNSLPSGKSSKQLLALLHGTRSCLEPDWIRGKEPLAPATLCPRMHPCDAWHSCLRVENIVHKNNNWTIEPNAS